MHVPRCDEELKNFVKFFETKQDHHRKVKMICNLEDHWRIWNLLYQPRRHETCIEMPFIQALFRSLQNSKKKDIKFSSTYIKY